MYIHCVVCWKVLTVNCSYSGGTACRQGQYYPELDVSVYSSKSRDKSPVLDDLPLYLLFL